MSRPTFPPTTSPRNDPLSDLAFAASCATLSNMETSTSHPPMPTAIERIDPASIQIVWSDGSALRYGASRLRHQCPCSTCNEKRRADREKPKSLLPVLSASDTIPLTIMHMRPVGNYAYNIGFSDGHSSGLFTMELLRELGEPSSPSENRG